MYFGWLVKALSQESFLPAREKRCNRKEEELTSATALVAHLLGNCTFFHSWRAEDDRRWEERGNRPAVQRPAAKYVGCGRTQSSQRFWKMAVLLLQGSTFTVANPATEKIVLSTYNERYPRLYAVKSPGFTDSFNKDSYLRKQRWYQLRRKKTRFKKKRLIIMYWRIK